MCRFQGASRKARAAFRRLTLNEKYFAGQPRVKDWQIASRSRNSPACARDRFNYTASPMTHGDMAAPHGRAKMQRTESGIYLRCDAGITNVLLVIGSVIAKSSTTSRAELCK